MGQICSVSNPKKHYSNKKKEALYQNKDLPVDFSVNPPIDLPTNPPINLPVSHPAINPLIDLSVDVPKRSIVKAPVISEKSPKFYIIKKPGTFHILTLKNWRKTHQTCKSLEYKQSSFSFEKAELLTILINSLSLKEIKEIAIHLQYSNDAHKLIAVKLTNLLKACRSIEKLDLSIITMDMTEKHFLDICKEIRNMVFLKHFVIDLSPRGDLTPQTIKDLARHLQRCRELESIEINAFSTCRWFSEKALAEFGRSLKRLGKLKRISLYKRYNEMSDEGFRLFIESLRAVKSLKELVLNFDNSSEMTTKGFEYVIEGLTRIEHLETLNLDFYACRKVKSDQVIAKLKSFDQLKRLNILRIEIGELDGSSQGMDLNGMLPWAEKQVSLKELQITTEKDGNGWSESGYYEFIMEGEAPGLYYSSKMEVADEELNAVVDYLRNDKKIMNVALVCTEQTYARLLLFRDPPQRKDLFVGCEELTEEDVGIPEEDFILQEPLKQRANKLTDEGAESFSQALERLPCLRFLYLEFQQREGQLRNKPLEILTESLKKLTTLVVLHLNFVNCGGFGDDYFMKLSDSLKCLLNLEKLHLKFIFNEQLTPEGLKYLADGLKSLKKLRTMELNFYLCEKMRKVGDFLKQLKADAGEDYFFYEQKDLYYKITRYPR